LYGWAGAFAALGFAGIVAGMLLLVWDILKSESSS